MLALGYRTPACLELIRYLNGLGANITEDYFGPETQESVIALQKFAGIEPTGIWNDVYYSLIKHRLAEHKTILFFTIDSLGGNLNGQGVSD